MQNLKSKNSKECALLILVRLGIGHHANPLTEKVDWAELKFLAIQHGLSAVVMDGIEELRMFERNVEMPDKRLLTQWIGEVLQGYEYRYESYCRAISDLARFYNAHGCKMMVLKGYACSLDWPKPNHRPTGDIDIWQFGKYREADALLASKKGIKVDDSHHHHTVFYWGDFVVENHYDFINTHDFKSSKSIEAIFKELGRDDSHFVELHGEKVYLPSPNLHALFLIRHMVAHFASVCIPLRQVLDWAFFVEKHSSEIDWDWLISVLEEYHMKEFYYCINAICIEDLGFDVSIFPKVQFNPSLKQRVLEDILNPKFEAEEPRFFFKRLIYKYRRWQGNAWKQNLCYPDSRWSGFWLGLWAHLLKPKSI